jgi:hypothetical protein
VWERPLRRGGPARTSGSRWKPKPVQLRFSFGLQEQPVLKWTPVAYRVGFGSSLYGWKDNFKKLLMDLVSSPNSSGVDRNHLHKLTSRICSGAATPSFGLLGCVLCQGPFGAHPRGLA